MDRTKTINLVKTYDIPKGTIAICASMAASNVSGFLGGGLMSSGAEERISSAILDIVKVIERFGPIRPDVSDGPGMKKLIENMKTQTVFAVLVTTNPARYFIRRKGKEVVL